MDYGCPRCNMQYSITSMLEEVPEAGVFVCKYDDTHRYKVGDDGFLVSTK